MYDEERMEEDEGCGSDLYKLLNLGHVAALVNESESTVAPS